MTGVSDLVGGLSLGVGEGAWCCGRDTGGAGWERRRKDGGGDGGVGSMVVVSGVIGGWITKGNSNGSNYEGDIVWIYME